mmetsp:Transcript_10805/g.30649  ORF Transcript_10805/g.30649 Transcript_10805/m.30649 type:complete len:457 (+) Transcript_10805:160-1530(+)
MVASDLIGKHAPVPRLTVATARPRWSSLRPGFRSQLQAGRLRISSRIPRRSLQLQAMDTGGESSDLRGPKVVVVGAGIAGCSTAYHLAKRGVAPIVLERSGIGAAASGKAGGFLARGWGDGTVTQDLHRKSFDMHEALAKELGIKSYRKIPVLTVSGEGRSRSAKGQKFAKWLDGNISSASMMDPTTAQVTPMELTTAFMDAACKNGAVFRKAVVQGIQTCPTDGSKRKVTGVELEGGEVVEADAVVIAMGPWSTLAGQWLDLPIPMTGVKSTSLVYKGCTPVQEEPFAMFVGEDSNGCHLEVYPRPNGEVYICGCGGSDYVTGGRIAPGGDCATPEQMHADPKRVAAASSSFKGLTSLGDRDPDSVQACMRPCPPDALPIMGPAPGVQGAYFACGHNCWGILWGPITGLAMSELVVDGEATCVDLDEFSPSRFMPAAAFGTRGRKRGAKPVGEQW